MIFSLLRRESWGRIVCLDAVDFLKETGGEVCTMMIVHCSNCALLGLTDGP